MQTAEWPSQILETREIGDYDYQVPLFDSDPSQFNGLAQADSASASVGFHAGVCADFILDDPPLG
jgi:hypothetical protein